MMCFFSTPFSSSIHVGFFFPVVVFDLNRDSCQQNYCLSEKSPFVNAVNAMAEESNAANILHRRATTQAHFPLTECHE